MGFDIKDIGGVGEPVKKLIEVISEGIGTLYRPRRMRDEADAKAYEIRAIAAAEADADMAKAQGLTTAKLTRINSLASGDQELIERARMRLLSREIEGQLNVEAIADQAMKSLPPSVSEKPVGDDWRRKFFLEAENICDRDLQALWGKVLAGEVTSPGSYSLRTLEVLKHLSKEDAELFRQACSIAFSDGWIMKVGLDRNRSLVPYGLTYNALLALRDAGLLYEGDTLVREWSQIASPELILLNNDVYIQISGPVLQQQNPPSLPFTRAGSELQNLIEPNPSMPYIKSVAEYFRARGLAVKKGTKTEIEQGGYAISFDEDF